MFVQLINRIFFPDKELIRDSVELNELQIQEIKSSINEADNNEFASDDAVRDTFKKWDVNEN